MKPQSKRLRAPQQRELPPDPDLDADEGPTGTPLPVHLSWRFIALVFVGGAAGTTARHLLSESMGSDGPFPLGTFAVNLIGAFALGLLLEWLALDGLDVGRRRGLRLLLGTGFLGGFTTYSALAVDTDALLRHGHGGLAFAYAVGTVALGLIAAVAGIALARRLAR